MSECLSIRIAGESSWDEILPMSEDWSINDEPICFVFDLPERGGEPAEEDEENGPIWVLTPGEGRQQIARARSMELDPELSGFYDSLEFLLDCAADEIEVQLRQ